MMKLFKTIEDLISRHTAQHKRCLELEAQRNTWIRRAVAMAGPDDIAQWAREGGGKHDINLKDRS